MRYRFPPRALAVLVLPLALLAGTATAARVPRPDAAEVRKALQDILDLRARAVEKKDIPGIMALLAEDFRGINTVGLPVLPEELSRTWKEALDPLTEVKVSEEIADITVTGDEATVLTRAKGSSVFNGPENKKYPVTSEAAYAITFVKTATGWKAKAAQDLMSAITFDGKPGIPSNGIPGEADAQKAIQEFYNKITAALRAGKADDVAALLPDDFAAKNADGSPTPRADLLEGMKMMASAPEKEAISVTLYNLRLRRDTLIANAVWRVKVTAEAGNLKGKMDILMSTRDTFKKTPEGWKPAEFALLLSASSVDGKAMPPQYARPVKK